MDINDEEDWAELDPVRHQQVDHAFTERARLYKEQLWWEDFHSRRTIGQRGHCRPDRSLWFATDQVDSVHNSALFWHEVLTSCDELFILVPRREYHLVDKDSFENYTESYDPGNVDQESDVPPKERICKDCKYAHPNRPLRFGGRQTHEYLEFRFCQGLIYWLPDSLVGRLQYLRDNLLNSFEKVSRAWDTGERTRPPPKVIFLGSLPRTRQPWTSSKYS